MKQLVQVLGSGATSVEEVPGPLASPGRIVVRNAFSVVSAGTEGATARVARKNLLGKALERPDQARLVMEVLRQKGPVETYRAVRKKLDAYSPLGYSCAGHVVAVGHDADGFAVGDRAACGGVGFANHAEVVSVPVNLAVKLSPTANLKFAAYNTLGAIALQGVRQADVRLGETCAVIGLGLIGQLTCLLLRASGVRVVGIDIDPYAVRLASEHCADLALVRETLGLESIVAALTGGLGADAVVITAGSTSLDPINLAGSLARKKGRVIVVGAVPTGFDREPHYYRKELELRMSCSYGPGRYDPGYEEKGQDYPPGYVRWTERRNMEAFQRLLEAGTIDVGYLTTHEVTLQEAPKAYGMILERSEPFIGVVIRYDVEKPLSSARVEVRHTAESGSPAIGFIGAGSYAQGSLLPHLGSGRSGVALRGVMTSSGATSKRVAERFGFAFCTSEAEDILQDSAINTVFIATRHDSHAAYVGRALEAGKHVFVEKPLALNEAELASVEAVFRAACERSPRQLLVGFNRRFAPLVQALKSQVAAGPLAMLYRVNAGPLPAGSWIADPEIGGGRVIGEVCHFVDLMVFLSGALPTSVFASGFGGECLGPDPVTVTLDFADGSTGTIHYITNGSKALFKELLEVHWQGCSAVLHDFRRLDLYSPRRHSTRSFVPDKGQRNMLRAFLESVKTGGLPVIPPEQTFAVTRATFAAPQSLREQARIPLR